MLSVLPADHITDYMNNTLVKYEPILLPTSSRNLHKDRDHKNPKKPMEIP